MAKAITKISLELLRSWQPCSDGYKRFTKLFPKGATLEVAMQGLIDDGHDDWAYWLFSACRDKNLFAETILKGYRNSGDRNSGDRNSGDRNSGDLNSGDRNSGYRNSGYLNSGDRNSGYRNSGDRNSGDLNSGYRNSGYRNSGDLNSGDRNSGDRNSGDRNSGDRNSGYRNSGDRNSGDLNRGNYNSGHFNFGTPEEITVFNKPCKRETWDKAQKPNFIWRFELTYWLDESEMTDADKAADPNFYVRGGQLRKRSYDEAWGLAWKGVTKEDIRILKALPNFDAEVFKKITGIDVEGK